MLKPHTQADKTAMIGSRIRFHSIYNDDDGREGYIVAIEEDDRPVIHIPNGKKHTKGRFPKYKGIVFTWHCNWSIIELLPSLVGSQYEFDFIKE